MSDSLPNVVDYVAIPNGAGRKGPNCKYPWANMKVGDSFWVGGNRHNLVCFSGNRWGKKNGMRFVSRAEGEGGRIWRFE